MKKRNEIIASILSALILISVSLSACAQAPVQTPILGLAQTLAVRTMVAMKGVEYFATRTPTPFPTATSPLFQDAPVSILSLEDTATPVPSLTPFGLSAYQQGSDPLGASGVCGNKAEFIQDVTYQDQSVLKPGQRFTKTWLLKNNGSCTWTKDYQIVFTFGDRMEGESPRFLGKDVIPGETVEISIDMVAPKNPDYYQGNWMLQDENGTLFGTGYGKRDFFWVAIVVGGNNGIGKLFGGICGGGG